MNAKADANQPFFVTEAIEIEQRIGSFFVAAIPARHLLEICFSERLQAKKSGETYSLTGAQREKVESRLREIGRYINTEDAAFPNAIVLAANYREKDGTIEEDDDLRWRVEFESTASESKRSNPIGGGCAQLVIPTSTKLATIVDGQHRLFGFTHASPEHLGTQLLCSVFLDLPKPYQAYLFATINSTQKPVDRSQTYELFGYNIEEEPENEWSPDKLAVFLARKLNTSGGSPFNQRILVSAENEFILSRSAARLQSRWMVSMATVVDGISRLISSSPRSDASELRVKRGRTRDHLMTIKRKDRSPLRALYLETRDKLIYSATLNYFKAAEELLFPEDNETDSFITKTIGIQALFDVLRIIVSEAMEQKTFTVDYFKQKFQPASNVDFSNEAFRNASGSGRTFIRQLLLYAMTDEADGLNEDRIKQFDKLLAG